MLILEGKTYKFFTIFSRLEYNSGEGVVYVVLATPPDMSDWVGNFSPTLKFVVKDCDPATGKF